jgi:hypothetical protein
LIEFWFLVVWFGIWHLYLSAFGYFDPDFTLLLQMFVSVLRSMQVRFMLCWLVVPADPLAAALADQAYFFVEDVLQVRSGLYFGLCKSYTSSCCMLCKICLWRDDVQGLRTRWQQHWLFCCTLLFPGCARMLFPGCARMLFPGCARMLFPGCARMLFPGCARMLDLLQSSPVLC